MCTDLYIQSISSVSLIILYVFLVHLSLEISFCTTQQKKPDIQQKLYVMMINNTIFVAQVSKQAKEFLEFVYEEPLLDVQQLNPCLYEHCEALAAVLKLRQQLQSLRAYLFSCRATVAEDLRRR